ncbi:MAG: hypothetical protein M2R45_01033 [Verrucomicrobia subdivision 3 bacterium]|nr:hypothetical protein [Limisphaerales bacterium]MCS1414145.1 hypothetical protein [Limisphaerales bacterium]
MRQLMNTFFFRLRGLVCFAMRYYAFVLWDKGESRDDVCFPFPFAHNGACSDAYDYEEKR